MAADIDTIRGQLQAIDSAETTVAGAMRFIVDPALAGAGAVRNAIEQFVRAEAAHARQIEAEAAAAAATAAGNIAMASSQRRIAASAARERDEAEVAAERAKIGARSNIAEIIGHIGVAATESDNAVRQAEDLVDADDVSPAADIRAMVANQPESINALGATANEADEIVSGSRDAERLNVAEQHLTVIADGAEKESGKAGSIAGMAQAHYDLQ
jgi:hypothetical protein